MASGKSHRAIAALAFTADKPRTTSARRRRRIYCAALIATSSALLASTIAAPLTPRLVWNISASASIGLYLTRPHIVLRRGDMVVARLPDAYRYFAATRHYLPAGVPLVKRIAAIEGDEVCTLGHAIFINAKAVVVARDHDNLGRPLPSWQGCIRLRRGQLFLVMRDKPASFDGRYFGLTQATDVIGKAQLLWAR